MAVGAYLILIYLDETLRPRVEEVHHLHDIGSWAYPIVMFAWIALLWRKEKGEPAPIEPSPAWVGSFVVLATGVAAAFFLGAGFHRASDFVTPSAILAVTIGGAILVARFARRHEKEIGEARFDTRNRGDAEHRNG
jgi:hypothetical protein